MSGRGQAERTAKSPVQDIRLRGSTRQKCVLWGGEQESAAARSRSRDQNLRDKLSAQLHVTAELLESRLLLSQQLRTMQNRISSSKWAPS